MKRFNLDNGHVLTIDPEAGAAYLAFVSIKNLGEVYTTCPTERINLDFDAKTDALVGMELLNLTHKFDGSLVVEETHKQSVEKANWLLKQQPVL